jgi:hypothetical protein
MDGAAYDVSEVPAASIIRAMMMGAASTSETSVNLCQTTRRNNPEGSNLRIVCLVLKNKRIYIRLFSSLIRMPSMKLVNGQIFNTVSQYPLMYQKKLLGSTERKKTIS